jgi:polar amino acid transport system substrate-binding protein
MARYSRVLATFAALSFVVASCGGDDSSSDTTVAEGGELELVKDGVLTVCSDAPYEPFEFQDENGEWTGFDMDVVRAIATENDLELEVSVQPFDGIWLAPAAGKCDMVASSMTITEERENAADFTKSYFDAFQSLLVRSEDAETYNSLDALAGKTIAVQTGTTGEAFANENKPEGATIQSFDEASAMFLALESGQVDAVLQDYLINKERADKQGTSTVSVKFEDTPEQYGFAVETGNSALLDILNKGIDDLKASGEYQKIYDKYFIG